MVRLQVRHQIRQLDKTPAERWVLELRQQQQLRSWCPLEMSVAPHAGAWIEKPAITPTAIMFIETK